MTIYKWTFRTNSIKVNNYEMMILIIVLFIFMQSDKQQKLQIYHK